ncbi:tRNA (adenosine(37)-N6)-threonylcarbamoyltransferase complex ATPase subunit type 1 TsaE [Candidatus Peregrinibacteria bacterium HGW-Peregrinibacteria-1]|jgi:tRNA threonylcarbamoyladenosine biosynthesis protein TsaE|nr:MAG: tRNA (adenosine(37)-N6)-threonylcarbamoyltransferase complex ATPase subunit type 1 TsaE [Candidatus Peregrinibacteria bacterium HGW-Peregrinibacteria-1]
MNINSLQDTEKLAAKIAPMLNETPILCLYGEIGSGKTTFTKFLAENLGLHGFKIKSPTYTYIKKYPLNEKHFYHIDLYRIENMDQLMREEITEIINDDNNIVVIEWPNRLTEILPKKRVELHFKYLQPDSRSIDIILTPTQSEH